MKLASTRNKNRQVSFKEAVFEGLAPDGGLYYPIGRADIRNIITSWNEKTDFNQVAYDICDILLTPELNSKELKRIIQRAFNFKPVLNQVASNLSFLELFYGPSCAFKDFGACFLASFMEEFLVKENKRAVILVATSGDTGSAVARAFFDKQNIDVVILYPSGRVSFLQEKQLTTLGKNIFALEVKGSFDDCQRIVKMAFQNPQLKKHIYLTSANSINIGRLFPQTFYYAYAYTQSSVKQRENIIFCVPSGNFGNLTAGVYSWFWGLPVKKFIAATNINDVVPEYLKTGIFTAKASKHTLSNAMDVGNPSNFERLVHLFNHNYSSMKSLIHGEVVNDEETIEAMQTVYNDYGIFIDPHTAVGYRAVIRFLSNNKHNINAIILATAHPAKFKDIVQKATKREPVLPESLKQALKKEKKSIVIEKNIDELCTFLLDNFQQFR